MSEDKSSQSTPESGKLEPASETGRDDKADPSQAPDSLDVSRRSVLAGITVGSVSAAALGFGVGRIAAASDRDRGRHDKRDKNDKRDKDRDRDHKRRRRKDSKHRTLLKNCFAILTMDPKDDLEGGDILVEGKKIVAIGPHLDAYAHDVVDCSSLIVMPGFISTHHHQYQTHQRSVNADGYITFGRPFGGPADDEQQQGAWPYESYIPLQNIWNSGQFTDIDGNTWDLGRSPMEPEDLYLSELVTSLSQLVQGVTCSTDTSQASHTPEHTDGMIKGLMDSGARALYAYTGGTNRAAVGDVSPTGFEHPGAIGVEDWGIGRLRRDFFSSDDQLVTLCLQSGPNPVTNRATGMQESYTGWELAKEFGAWIDSHNIAGPGVINDNVTLLEDPEIGPKFTIIHAVRWQDPAEPLVQVGATGSGDPGYPSSAEIQAWQRAHDLGVHFSIACPLELQMRHGLPPIQLALNHGIMPSLSPDVECNQTTSPFNMMRGAFNLQRGLGSELAFPASDPGGLVAPQSLTCYEVLQMMTHAGAVGSGLEGRVGMLKKGYEADIIFLETNDIQIAPANNAPGTVVTMMDSRHVRHVMVAGEFKVWNYELVGWKVDKLIRRINAQRDRIIERIREVPFPQPGKNTRIDPYTPPFLTSCCFEGQNDVAPRYVLRP